MLQELTLFIATLTGITLTILIMFLPTIVELKKPRDVGPRLIPDTFAKVRLSTLTSLFNIDEESKFEGQSALKTANLLRFLPNLES